MSKPNKLLSPVTAISRRPVLDEEGKQARAPNRLRQVLDEEGKPVVNADGTSKMDYKRDEDGNIIPGKLQWQPLSWSDVEGMTFGPRTQRVSEEDGTIITCEGRALESDTELPELAEFADPLDYWKLYANKVLPSFVARATAEVERLQAIPVESRVAHPAESKGRVSAKAKLDALQDALKVKEALSKLLSEAIAPYAAVGDSAMIAAISQRAILPLALAPATSSADDLRGIVRAAETELGVTLIPDTDDNDN